MRITAQWAAWQVESHRANVRRRVIFHASGTLPAARLVPSRSGQESAWLALLVVSTVLVIVVGCARLQPTAAPLQPAPTARQEVIAQIVASSVKVAIGQKAQQLMFASGIVIASRPARQDAEAVSYVLTAAHALADGNNGPIFVGFCGADAARGKFAATMISRGQPETLDLALLRVPGIAAPPVVLPDDDAIRLGALILVVGFPEGQRLGLSAGIVSQLPLSEIQNGIPADRAERRIVIDAAAPRGVSGGGVFDAETGTLVGIVQGHHTFSIAMKDQTQSYALKLPVPGSTFVVPVAEIRPFLGSSAVASELLGVVPITARASRSLP
jgi:serine protease Do